MDEDEIEIQPNVAYLPCLGTALRANKSTNEHDTHEEVELIEQSRKPVPVVPTTPVHVKSLPIKSVVLVILMVTLVIVIAIISSALAISVIRFTEKERGFQKVIDAYKINSTLSKEDGLKMEIKMLHELCAFVNTTNKDITGEDNVKDIRSGTMPLQNCSSSDFNLTNGNSGGVNSSNVVTSCKMLSKSCPSGYYMILASNGSAIKVYCEMNKTTCGEVSGGWMRVTSLDMKEESAKCPSSLCLNTTTPRTCRRCYTPGIINFVAETYQVGVSYSNVCGRLIAYQIGMPNAYSSVHTLGVDGVSLTYGNPEENIWTFIAANSDYASNMCQCIKPSIKRILAPPAFISNHYFCDTALSVSARKAEFYSENPLWDGSGCQGENQCCSFNNPPWFHRRLSSSTSEPIVMKVSINKPPLFEDVAIEVMDIYVQ